VNRYVTGNLQGRVEGFPRYPYTEAIYLRCIIQRISASTIVVPKGVYIYDNENQVVVNEEWDGRSSASDLQYGEGWTHSRIPIINSIGRETYVENDDEEEDEEKIAIRNASREPVIPQLRSLEKDRENTWSFRITPRADELSVKAVDDPTVPKKEEEEDNNSSNVDNSNSVVKNRKYTQSIGIARHNIWNGAVTAARNKQYYSIYVGYGIRTLQQPYAPQKPPPFQQEYRVPVSQLRVDDKGTTADNIILEQADNIVEPPKRKVINDDGDEIEEDDVIIDEEEDDENADEEEI